MTHVIVTSKDELEHLIQNSVRKVLSEQEHYAHPETPDKLFSIDEAAAFLNLARQTLYGMTSKREIPFIKRGKLYFRKSDLEQWLLEGKKKTVVEIKAELERGLK